MAMDLSNGYQRCIRYQRTPHCNHGNISSFQHISSPRRQIMKIDSLPTSVACSICSRGTNAIGGGDFWCNYCNDKVSPLTKVKFGLRITDPTGSIDAVIFADVAEKFFNITAAEIKDNHYRCKIHITHYVTYNFQLPSHQINLLHHIQEDHLSMNVIQKLSAPRKCSMNLKVYQNDYGGIKQCKFSIKSQSFPKAFHR